MKIRDEKKESGSVMTWDDDFCFECKPGIDCFNTCCRDVTIFLSPLDVLRLRTALGINSTEFIDTYTHRVITRQGGMPAIVLKMGADEDKVCPFVGKEGCTVYENRPYSCRLYPLDSAAGVEFSFIVDADACHGLTMTKKWTVESWLQKQGLTEYEDLDHNLKDVMSADLVWETRIEDPRMQDMILMALYDADRFREFIFESSFLQKFRIDDDIVKKIRNDDVALLYFGAQWLRFALFGKKGFLKIDRDYLEKKKREILEDKTAHDVKHD